MSSRKPDPEREWTSFRPGYDTRSAHDAMTFDTDALRYVCCPVCGDDFAIDDRSLVCASAHRFPITDGVPELLRPSQEAAIISDTFGAQWSRHKYGEDRTWDKNLDDRISDFLGQLDVAPEWLRGKDVLDAGCGSGELTHEIAVRFNPRMFGTDISPSVFAANNRFANNVVFFRSDLSRSALRPAMFDAIYCGGVLHHTQSTRRALEQLAPAVRPGGRIFVWLYWKLPSPIYRTKVALRRCVAPLPSRLQQPIVDVVAGLSWLRHWASGTNARWSDHRLIQHDFWTPRFRWEHTPDEVLSWFASLGFKGAQVQSEDRDGFGILAHRPAA